MRQFFQLLFLTSFASVACAQVPAIRGGSVEVGGFVGASYGLTNYRVMGGGNVSYAINKYILPYGEFSYFPGVDRTLATGTFPSTGATYKISGPMSISDFHGGVHFRYPIKESRLVPYGVFGVGGLNFSGFNANIAYTDSLGASHQIPNFSVPGGTYFAINYGGGLRYYLSPTWGMRVEAKGYKPTGPSGSAYSDPFLKVEFGVFIQLH